MILTLRCSLRMNFRSIQGTAPGLVKWIEQMLGPDYGCLCEQISALKKQPPKLVIAGLQSCWSTRVI